MPTNNFVPFCNENTGTNLPTQNAYIADPNLPIGNQPGIASSAFNNKALRQGTTIAAVLAQYVSDTQAIDMLDNQNTADHANPPALLKGLEAALRRLTPVITDYTSGSGNHNLSYKFFITNPSVAPTAGATYSDGTTTYTVKTTYVNNTELHATGGTAPAVTAGTLTKTGGTGDATLTFYAYRRPLTMKVKIWGGGGSGAGGGVATPGNGTAGNASTWGSLSAGGGAAGTWSVSGGGAGGTNTFSGNGFETPGGAGQGGCYINNAGVDIGGAGGRGGDSFGGGGGPGGSVSSAGQNGRANSGAGGGGGGAYSSGGTPVKSGGAGGAGGYIEADISNPSSQYAYAVGAAQTSVGSGTGGGANGGQGAAGRIIVYESYQ
ncbi:MAG: hypothetical protein OEW15_11710 [Nitrospirota bacterium]|nr:hypothetical protein [Nitrospirota bacterium]